MDKEKTMQGNELLIAFSVMGAILGIVFTVIAIKEPKYGKLQLAIGAVVWYLIPAMIVPSLLFGPEKLRYAALSCSLGLIFICFPLLILIKYKNCTQPIMAKFIGYKTVSGGRRPRRYAPKFVYMFNDEKIEMWSFTSYYKRKCKKLFVENEDYEIYINPNLPKHCADKRTYPVSAVVLIILGIVFLLVSVYVALSA